MANGTPALQAAQASTADIPILGTSITEYGVALGIDDFSGTVGGNISGTSDLAPLDEQAAMIVEWMPDAQTVGLLYCSAEPNSQYQVDVVQAELEAAGLTVTQYPFSDSNDLSSVCQQAATESDVLYVPHRQHGGRQHRHCGRHLPPHGQARLCGRGGHLPGLRRGHPVHQLLRPGLHHRRDGRQILTGEADIAAMPHPVHQRHQEIQPHICEELGLTVPEGYEAIEEA